MRDIVTKIETDKYIYIETKLDEWAGLISILKSDVTVWNCINELDFAEQYRGQKIIIDMALKKRQNPLRFADYTIGKSIGKDLKLEYAFPSDDTIEFANSVLREHVECVEKSCVGKKMRECILGKAEV